MRVLSIRASQDKLWRGGVTGPSPPLPSTFTSDCLDVAGRIVALAHVVHPRNPALCIQASLTAANHIGATIGDWECVLLHGEQALRDIEAHEAALMKSPRGSKRRGSSRSGVRFAEPAVGSAEDKLRRTSYAPTSTGGVGATSGGSASGGPSSTLSAHSGVADVVAEAALSVDPSIMPRELTGGNDVAANIPSPEPAVAKRSAPLVPDASQMVGS